MDFLPLIILISVAVYFALRKKPPALFACRDCGHQVSRTAATCPGCGAKVPKSMGILGWFALIIGTMIVYQCTTSSVRRDAGKMAQTPEQRADAAAEQNLSDAKWQCREFVTKTLKAPATAKFQNYNEFAARQDASGIYQVNGFVDSQNGFGAMIRTQFHCELHRNGQGNWLLLNLTNP